MPSSHLACDGSTETVSCPYPPFRAASARPPCGGRSPGGGGGGYSLCKAIRACAALVGHFFEKNP